MTREQQLAFNEAYLALGDDVQEFARQMFVTVSEAQQEHAFNAFLSLDLATLTAVLQKEMAEQQALAEAETEVRSEKNFIFQAAKSCHGEQFSKRYFNTSNFQAARLAEAQKQARERQRQLERQQQVLLNIVFNLFLLHFCQVVLSSTLIFAFFYFISLV